MARLQPAERARLRRSRIGVVLQTFGLVPSISVLDNVALPLALDGVESVSAGSRSREALAQVGLERQASARVDELSGGQRQRVAIARAMVIGPELILADEPIGNLDEGSGRQVVELLRGLAREGGAALVIVTHDPLTARGADRRIGLRDGRILAAPERDAIAGVHTR
jgi:putative ABC transport system ATP-binding protein